MSALPRAVAANGAPLRVRNEGPEDAPFLFELFRARALEVLAAAELRPEVADHLVALQHRAQTASYRAAFPQARVQVVERGCERVGRLVEADEPGGVYIVDLAVASGHRRTGVAAALIADLQGRCGRDGAHVRAQVSVTNAPSRALFSRMGFAAEGRQTTGDVNLMWRSSPAGAGDVAIPCG